MPFGLVNIKLSVAVLKSSLASNMIPFLLLFLTELCKAGQMRAWRELREGICMIA